MRKIIMFFIASSALNIICLENGVSQINEVETSKSFNNLDSESRIQEPKEVGIEGFVVATGHGLMINNELWRRVDDLDNSGPNDRHYMMVIEENGNTTITFGDGEKGARLPIGERNIRTTYNHGPGKNYSGVKMKQGKVLMDDDWNRVATQKYCGIYKATVTNNVDPMSSMRVKVKIPNVLGKKEVWAVPCKNVGSSSSPAIGQSIWVMFENGDPDRPVWMGTI